MDDHEHDYYDDDLILVVVITFSIINVIIIIILSLLSSSLQLFQDSNDDVNVKDDDSGDSGDFHGVSYY